MLAPNWRRVKAVSYKSPRMHASVKGVRPSLSTNCHNKIPEVQQTGVEMASIIEG